VVYCVLVQWNFLKDWEVYNIIVTACISCCLLLSLQDYWLDLYCLLWQVKLLVWFPCVLTYLGLSWTGTSLSYYQQKTTQPLVSFSLCSSCWAYEWEVALLVLSHFICANNGAYIWHHIMKAHKLYTYNASIMHRRLDKLVFIFSPFNCLHLHSVQLLMTTQLLALNL